MDGKFHRPNDWDAAKDDLEDAGKPGHASDSGPKALSREEMVQICARLMHLRRAGNFAEFAQFMTEDFELFCPGIPGHNPVAGRFKGREECLKAMRLNFTLIETVKLVPQEFIVDDDSVAISWTGFARNRGTGPTVKLEGFARLRFRGSKICFYSNHVDTAAISALLQYPELRITGARRS